MRQRSRKLWQVFHTYPTRSHPSGPAGHCQHRPGRVRRLFLHQPSVPPSIPAQRGMRRERTEILKEGKPHKKRMTVTVYRFLPVSTKHPAVNRLDSSSAVLRLLAINTRIEKWLRRGEQSVKTIYVQSKENRFPKHLTVCSFILTLCLFFQTRSLYLVNKCVSVSVTL